MSAVGVVVGFGIQVALVAGTGALIYWGTGGFGEDDAKAAKDAAAAARRDNEKAQKASMMAELKARKDLNPYAQAGRNALEEQQALSGALGPEAQAQAIAALENSPEFAAYAAQGEEAILANASATGGLRGGNTQGALAQFRPQLLNRLIEQKLGRLGGLTNAGQAASTNQANIGMQSGANAINLYGDAGSIEAGGILGEQTGRSAGRAQATNLVFNAAGTAASLATGA